MRTFVILIFAFISLAKKYDDIHNLYTIRTNNKMIIDGILLLYKHKFIIFKCFYQQGQNHLFLDITPPETDAYPIIYFEFDPSGFPVFEDCVRLDKNKVKGLTLNRNRYGVETEVVDIFFTVNNVPVIKVVNEDSHTYTGLTFIKKYDLRDSDNILYIVSWSLAIKVYKNNKFYWNDLMVYN
jgi:hypothetical protein